MATAPALDPSLMNGMPMNGVPAQPPAGAMAPIHADNSISGAYRSSERTADEPQTGAPADPQNASGLTDKEGKELLQQAKAITEKWSIRRRQIVQRCLKAFEFFKGNQFVSFDPEDFQYFDSIQMAQQMNLASGADDDDALYQFCTNLTQMLAVNFVAAITPQVPKSRFFPNDVDVEVDIATAREASTLQEIIERRNKITKRQKQAALIFFLCGCYFRHTRYVVDGDRWGTHDEPVMEDAQVEMLPDRYHCQDCGGVTPAVSQALATQPTCQQCNQPVSEEDYWPSVTGTMPQQTGTQKVANGSTTYTFYSPLYVEVDPEARSIAKSDLLKLSRETSIGVLRDRYPDQWKALGEAMGAGNSLADRQARSYVLADTGGVQSQTGDKPTFDTYWLQPSAFNTFDDKEKAARYHQLFPTGVKIDGVGDLFLGAVEARVGDEWTWCGTVDEEYGCYPPSSADLCIPCNERLNDVENLKHEHLDRNSSGILLANTDVISPKSLNGKPLLAGVLNGVKLKRTMPGMRLEDAFFHLKAEADPQLYEESDRLMMMAQTLTGVLPQIFGGSGDPNVQTFGGQEQQHSTALGKLMLYWDNMRDEFADASGVGVKCTARYETDDIMDTYLDETQQFRKQYVRIQNLRGAVNCYPETSQGFPMTYDQMRSMWSQLLTQAVQNPIIGELLQEPENQALAIQYCGAPGMVNPGKALREKVLEVIDQLVAPGAAPKQVMQPNPLTGQMMPVTMPSVIPNEDIDIPDAPTIIETIRNYALKHPEIPDVNPDGFENLIAYLRLVKQMQLKAQMANAPPPPPGGDDQNKEQGPPKKPN